MVPEANICHTGLQIRPLEAFILKWIIYTKQNSVNSISYLTS